MPFLYCSLALIVLIGLYFFAILGRPKKGRMEHLKKWSYAHRGLHREGVPENSMAAFRAALDAGCGVELDLHVALDSGVNVRTTCRNLQHQVRYQVQHTCGVTVEKINVYVATVKA